MASLEVTTVIGCELACKFCPQPQLVKAYSGGNAKNNKIMSANNYKRWLLKIPGHVKIFFSGMSEPFLNPDCFEMIRHTIDSRGHKVGIYTTLQGFNNKNLDEFVNMIYENKIDPLTIHLPDSKNNMTGFKISNDYLIALRSLACLPGVSVMTMDQSGIPASPIREVLTKLFEKNDMLDRLPAPWNANDRAGSLVIKEASLGSMVSHSDTGIAPISCSTSKFYDDNVLLPNGDVALCCMDYSLKHILGNLSIDSYYDLFRSDEMANLYSLNMMASPTKTQCEASICRSCDRAYQHKLIPDSFNRWV